MSRAAAVDAFLRAAGLGDAPRAPLAGDASARRYLRVGGRVLMDAPPGAGSDVGPFLDVAERLARAGLSVPRIEAADVGAGLVLMEDLGDDLLSRSPDPDRHAAAVDAALALAVAPADGLPDHAAAMADAVDVVEEWYAPGAAGAALRDAVALVLRDLPAGRALIHRDYHAANLLWLPDRAGAARIGVLDFQDAGAGPVDYDLASLLRDVRRDVPACVARMAVERAATARGRPAEEVARGVAICAAQRNLRILGVFARLCLRDGKTGYLEALPRTWALLQDDLRHPALGPLRDVVWGALPPPDPARLTALAARAGRGAP